MNFKFKLYITFLLLFSIQLLISLYLNNWHFAYPLDDTYIHLAIAKNFGLHGVWGPTQFEFASASSSLLYTLILSSFFFLGIGNVYLPLIINIIAVYFLIQASEKLLYSLTNSEELKKLFLILVVLFMPSLALTLTGMEHILQTIFVVYLTYYFLNNLSSNNKSLIPLLIFSFLAVATRYESLFLISGLCVILFMRKKFIQFVLLLVISFLPVIIFGSISLEKGAYFLPNSLMLKGNIPTFSIESIFNIFEEIFRKIIEAPHIFSSLVLLLFLILFTKPKSMKQDTFILSVILLIGWIFQLGLAKIGWFYRYEAYLLVLTIIVSIKLFDFALPRFNFTKQKSKETILSLLRNPKIVFFFSILIIPLSYRLTSSLYKSALAPKNIYEQQVQMAQFVKANAFKTVVLNDIGTTCYDNDLKLIDIQGLGTNGILKLSKQSNYKDFEVFEYAEHLKAELAITYDLKLMFDCSPRWKKIASWKIKNNVICWKDEVFIYVVDTTKMEELTDKIRKFSEILPKDVDVKYY